MVKLAGISVSGWGVGADAVDVAGQEGVFSGAVGRSCVVLCCGFVCELRCWCLQEYLNLVVAG